MALETAKLIEGIATNPEVAPFKRAFAAGLLLMTYASLRFSGSQSLLTFEVNEDAAHGTLTSCKTKRPHGLDWPWACPRLGVTGSRDWVAPLVEFRQAHLKANGHEPQFTFPRIDHLWQLESAVGASYASTRRKLALMCTALGDTSGESYTLHSPKNFLPTAAMQMNFSTRELNVIGHWSSSSKMPERYDRSVCSNELLLRNTIMSKFNDGWTTVPSFHLPITVDTSQRIGKPGEEADVTAPTQTTVDAPSVDDPAVTQTETLVPEDDTQTHDDEKLALSQERSTKICPK